MKTLLPAVPNGTGTTVTLSGIVAAFVAFLTAAINAGAEFYQDPGVITLFVTFIGLVATFYGARSYQAGQLYKPVDPSVPAEVVDYAGELVPDKPTDVDKDAVTS